MSLKDIEETMEMLRKKGATNLQVASCRYWEGARLTHPEDLKVSKE